MKFITTILALLFFCSLSFSQYSFDSIYTDFVLHDKRVAFDKYMRERTINETFSLQLDSNSEDRYESACWIISQFAIQSPEIENGFAKLFAQYDSLLTSTKRAFLEAVYGVYPTLYEDQIKNIVSKETIPKLFAMEELYLLRNNASPGNIKLLQKQLQQQFRGFDTITVLSELKKYLANHNNFIQHSTPDIPQLFQNQKTFSQKIIYSFQRWNRDYPGLAIIQNEDGSFVKDSSGKLLVFEQLARSASNLPYFITNGNTPQGIFSIQGTEIAHNHIIGPTPNIQLVMPFEADSIYWHTPYDSAKDALTNYINLLPESWRNWEPVREAFYAGKAGRTEIIAHGTTVDPDYFKGKTYYPISPTLGCLCGKEIWNIFTGKLVLSDQFNLIHNFLSTPGDKGYLFVINLDNQQKAVSREELEQLVKQAEK